jgi:type VI secretion system secreted protein VgrG
MADYAQAGRPLRVTTPLGRDVLLLLSLRGEEGISRLFRFDLVLQAENDQTVAFEAALGKKVSVELDSATGGSRIFAGICASISQGGRDEFFTAYHMEVVPELWLLTRKSQSRIFQNQTVPEILKKVFQGLKFEFKLKGRYEPRDFCVQYRETDFAFASRLMEEEGIFYFFSHAAGEHTLVLGDTPDVFPPLPLSSTVKFGNVEGKYVEEDRVESWLRRQSVRSGKVTLWDHTFEKPHEHLESQQPITDSVQAGTVSHRLRVGASDRLELYEWPGQYAQRFDGIDPGGGERPGDLQKIMPDGRRTAEFGKCRRAIGSRFRNISTPMATMW